MLFLKLVATYLVEPLFLLGLVASYILYLTRIKRERHFFRIAVNRDFYELRHFLKHGLLLGISGSIVTLGLGLTLGWQVVVIYQALACLALVAGIQANLAFLALLLTGLLAGGVTYLNPSWWSFDKIVPSQLTGVMLLVVLYLAFKLVLLRAQKFDWFSPQIKAGKRGRRIATYFWREVSVVPLVVLVPGSWLKVSGAWPVLTIGHQSYSLFIMPFLIAVSVKLAKQVPTMALGLYRKQTWLLLGLASGLTVVSHFYPSASLVGFGSLALLWLYQAYRRKQADLRADFWYVETNQGVRVVAVKPKTPAAKMQLVPGDIIIECNQQLVNSEAELYQALQANSAYCKLRVRGFNGELRLAESAIYAGAPHEIGLILFH